MVKVTRMVTIALMATAVIATASPSRASAGAGCPPAGGVTVVVDFGDLGGGEVVVGCAPSPGSGFEALAQSGFEVTQVQSSAGFVCRIDGLPAAETEDCLDVPPATSFWAYWTADLGGSWRSSTLGAGASVAGDLEGWSFNQGTSAAPRFAVPPAPTPTTTTTTATTATTSTVTTTTTTTATTTTTTTAPATTTADATPDTTMPNRSTTTATREGATSVPFTAPSTTTPPTSSTSSTPPASVPPNAADTTLAGTEDPAGSSPVGSIVGAAAVTVMAGAGILVARRRQREP